MYRRKIIDNAIDKVKELRRVDILDKVVREDKNMNRVRAVFRYDLRDYEEKFRSRRWGSSLPGLRTRDPLLSPPST